MAEPSCNRVVFHQCTQFIVANSTSVSSAHAGCEYISSVLYNPLTVSARALMLLSLSSHDFACVWVRFADR